jgi:phenylacetate-CoA ligase
VRGVEAPSQGASDATMLAPIKFIGKSQVCGLDLGPMNSIPPLRQRIYEMLMESQFWPPVQMLEFQRSQLAQLLRHAKATVPFYKTRLDPLFEKNDKINWDRWHEIPIVTRADLRAHRTELLARELPPGHGPIKEFSTSGSSGVPITITATSIATAAKRAAHARSEKLHALKHSKCRAIFDFPSEFEDWDEVIRNRKKMPIGGLKPGPQGNILKVSTEATDTDKLSALRRGKATILSSLPNDIEIIARKNLRLPQRDRVKLENILCFGQGPTGEQRDLFWRSFGAKTVEIYSSKEAGFMAFQCTSGTHFHVNSEMVFLEVLNGQGLACVPGEIGRVVVTPLYSTAQPLIRYEQGDMATPGLMCSCGINLPVLGKIDGRQDPILKLPGRLVTEMLVNKDLLSDTLKADAFQVAQVSELQFEIRYIARRLATPACKGMITKHLRSVLHPQLSVNYRKVREIPRNAGGKQQRFVREFA